jgi:hypothetical protein
LAAAFAGIGIRLANADDPKKPDLSDLRDAVVAAAKRGDNVTEIRTALDALEKSIAKGWTAPEPGKTVEPSAELIALRAVVESAARKGENVEEIRKQLELVEKAMTGKVQVQPKPLPKPEDPLTPPNPFPDFRPRPLPGPIPGRPLPPFGGLDNEDVRKAQEMMAKAAERLLANPNDPEALRMMQEANQLMLKGMLNGRNGLGGFEVMPVLPDRGFGRVPERFRLGVRLERVSELAADQLGIEVGRGIGITDVVDGSPADKAGFKTHDIVLEFDGKPVSDSPEDFTRQVQAARNGAKLTAVVLRKGKRVELTGIELPVPQQVVPREPLRRERGIDIVPPLGGLREGRFDSVSVTESNGEVTIKAVRNGVRYQIEGKRVEGEVIPSKITIREGDNTIEAETMDKVPEVHRGTIEGFLGRRNRK